ncbi:MAG: 30S ribosomal protein S3ae [Candidatus Brockarchaeota archaeon]|nr:30S ribosomal protein S3ae [Candidatus Brockarchaeota archaeon]
MSKAAKKPRTKWGAKEWYTVVAPTYFGEKVLGSIPANSPDQLVGRKVEVSLYDITEDPAHYQIKLFFKIVSVEGTRTNTIFWGHEYTRDYLRSLVRRGSSKIDAIVDVSTANNFKLRVGVVVFTRRRASRSQKNAIRKLIASVVTKKASSLNLDQLAQELVLGKVDSEVHNAVKKIHGIRRTGIRKSKVVSPSPEVSAMLSAQQAGAVQQEAAA